MRVDVANRILEGTGFAVARARGRSYTIARRSDTEYCRWEVLRERGVAFAHTIEEAVSWAYADGGRPEETFGTVAETVEAIGEEGQLCVGLGEGH